MKNYICYFLLVWVFFACEEKDSLSNAGYLELGVTKNVEVISKAVDPSTQPLAVAICQTVSGKVDTVKYYSDFEEMSGERIVLPAGTYMLKVATNRSDKSGFNQPSFAGINEKVVVKQGETTKASVECLLTNVKVTTEYSKPVREKFRSCVASIGNAESGFLSYGMDEKRAGYFLPGYLLVKLTVENKEGVKFSMSKLIESTKAREHYNFIFDLVPSNGNDSGMDFDIKIDTNPTNDEEHTVTIPLPETGYEQYAPKLDLLSGDGMPAENTITVSAGEKAPLILKAVSDNIGLKSITMIATSSNFEKLGLPPVLNLAALSADQKEVLAQLNISVPEISDPKVAFEVDFSEMIASLSGGTHSFLFSAQDELGQEVVKSVVVVVNLDLNTSPVRVSEVWAHYATLRGYIKNASLDHAETYKFEYKKSAEGDDAWKTAEGAVTVLTALEDGCNIKQLVTHLDDGTSYDYRLVQEETPADNLTFTTEKAEALKNGDFEDDANGPWNTTSTSFWSSGNNTFANDLAEKVENDGSAAACLTSKFAGIGGSLGKFAAGNAFTGSFAMSGMDGTVTLGKEFKSRPSYLIGKYKYDPKVIGKYGGKVTLSDGTEITVSGTDTCAIYIVLLNKQIAMNTGDKSSLFSLKRYAKEIVAFAELPTDRAGKATSGYEDFNLKLDYLQPNVKPSYIGVLCTSSKYGDYFLGAEGSVLYIDDFKLLYDDAPDK